ncbi:MAG TPA: efflux RND transporter periplasmic adaptor subunit [Polyangia bacterium]|nr:efflux RND transporter periplasmic adaptor subunit [Polyangia bacterium]
MSTDGAQSSPKPPARRRRLWWGISAAVVVALTALWVVRGRAERDDPAAAKGRGGGERVVPVLLTPVQRRDVPIYLEALGTVTAFKTVNVHSLVDGRLVRVAFVEGSTVKKGALLAEVDPRPFTIQLHQAEAALARDEAQLRGAERNLTRYAAVSAERLIPEQQTDDQRATVEGLRGTVAADRAQIESARLSLSYARIVSPIDGVTGVRMVDQGNIVHPSDPTGIVVVTQMDPIAVMFTLPEDDLPRLRQAQARGPVTVEARSRDGEVSLAKGELALIDNQINQTTATLRGKAVFANPDHGLWPNQFVKLRVLVDTRRAALVIPAVAIQRGPQGPFVYVVAGQDAAAQRPVKLESIEGADAILESGVNPGEQVVVEGQAQLRPGAKVSVRPAGQGPDNSGQAGGSAGGPSNRLGGTPP